MMVQKSPPVGKEWLRCRKHDGIMATNKSKEQRKKKSSAADLHTIHYVTYCTPAHTFTVIKQKSYTPSSFTQHQSQPSPSSSPSPPAH
ncbi:hypothetical protein CYLTODRAFT_253403 [Cylindrobasidium torrendii FP15055 ss-10]|uniref:Uncharacterized protein n=1 Tax=Cylindrobasidium torrendii FP15055 ss-10 TaxID=1314674 RepID=A0A0D7ASH7_9AGAR|nr:hypothetical protein CYLTODRAFT_253403 [Cylindrobasidium torrendii FP15055 ss-10]